MTHPFSWYTVICPVVFPSSLPMPAHVNGKELGPSYMNESCDNFNMHRVDRVVSTDLPDSVLYPECVGASHFVVGRDKLLDMSGFKQMSCMCSRLQVLILPWYNPHDADKSNNEPAVPGVNSWTPEINDLFIQCASNAIYSSLATNAGVRMLIWRTDMEYIKDMISLSELINADQKKLSLFMPGNKAQSNVESCQLFFHHSKTDNPIQMLTEQSTDNLFYTCVLVRADQLETLPASLQAFVNITDAYITKLKARPIRLFEPYYPHMHISHLSSQP